jgi:type IV secretory pathway TrbD component
MLAGAPVGITLVAGVAAPAIIIGLPVWVGKKVSGRALFAYVGGVC